MVSLCGTLPSKKVGVDLSLVPQVEGERAVHLLQRQGRVTLYHALRRKSLAEQINERIQGNTRVSHPVHILNLPTRHWGQLR